MKDRGKASRKTEGSEAAKKPQTDLQILDFERGSEIVWLLQRAYAQCAELKQFLRTWIQNRTRERQFGETLVNFGQI